MADRNVTIFTFNNNEALAVDSLLDSYVDGSTGGSVRWRIPSRNSDKIVGELANGETAEIRHKPLRAQGNVIAGAELARTALQNLDATDPADDIYIYYACCGALDAGLKGNAYRVSRVQYISLGSVKPVKSKDKNAATSAASEEPASAGYVEVVETAKLKNKWFVRTDPSWQEPLSSIALPTGTDAAPGRLRFLNIDPAFVLATDKVIEILPARDAPPSNGSDSQGPIYKDAEWTYGQALAQCRDHCKEELSGPILIEMETFGVAQIALATGLLRRVLVIRVVTDGLLNKSDQPTGTQLEILMDNRSVLDHALATIMGIVDGTTT